MKSKLISLFAATTTTLLLAINTNAASTGQSVLPQARPVQKSSEWKPHVGLMIGAAQPEGSGSTSSEFGVELGYQPYIPFGLAAEYTHSRIDDGFEKMNRDTVWAKGSYNFGGTTTFIKDSYVGLGLGAVFKTDRTSVAFAPIAGFDIPLKHDDQQFLSLGASTRYAIVSDGDVDTFSLSGVLKYWY